MLLWNGTQVTKVRKIFFKLLKPTLSINFATFDQFSTLKNDGQFSTLVNTLRYAEPYSVGTQKSLVSQLILQTKFQLSILNFLSLFCLAQTSPTHCAGRHVIINQLSGSKAKIKTSFSKILVYVIFLYHWPN